MPQCHPNQLPRSQGKNSAGCGRSYHHDGWQINRFHQFLGKQCPGAMRYEDWWLTNVLHSGSKSGQMVIK